MNGVQKIEFPRINEPRGNLSVIENSIHIPYDIKRIYYLYDVPGGSHRGGHAHTELLQTIIALSGSFDIHLDNGFEQETIHLNRPYEGLLLPTMVWRTIDNFSSGSVCLVLASDFYKSEEYIYDYDEFIQKARAGK